MTSLVKRMNKLIGDKKKVFLNISHYLHENTGKRQNAANLSKKDSTLVFSCQLCEIFKNTFFQKTPPVAAFVIFK